MNFRIFMLSAVLINCNALAQADSLGKVALPATKSRVRDKNAAKVYHIRKAIDYPVILAVGLESIYALNVIYTKKPTSDADLQQLNRNNIPAFDRWATKYHDLKIDKMSYYPFYAVMPLPLLLLLDKKIAKDKGTIGLLYLEAFAFEGFLYTSSGFLANRYRPDVYNTSLSNLYREDGNNRNSFFAGHVAVVANATFFMAKVYNDYHPGSNMRWVFYGGATAATLAMGYLRLTAGKHFPSDIAAGALVGTACGILTPAIHRNRNFKTQKWSMNPGIFDKGETGFTFVYKL